MLASVKSHWLSLFCLAVCFGAGGEVSVVVAQNVASPIDFDFQKLEVDSTSSLRGLCVVDSKTVWTTGSQGTILRTTDGQHWESLSLPGRSEVEIRDVFAWSADHAIVMIAGQPAEIWETVDGGTQWRRVFVDGRKTAFLDDILIDFESGKGLAFGDVVDSAIPLVNREADGKWYLREDLADLSQIEYLHGYAASGTSMIHLESGEFLIGTGGASPTESNSVVLVSQPDNWRKWSQSVCPIPASQSAGIFSLSVSGSRIVAVGGDYLKPEFSQAVAGFSSDRGETWELAQTMPRGFRSGVAKVNGSNAEAVFICVGTNGSDVSSDGGENWRALNQLNLNAVQFSKSGKIGWAVGSNGAIYRIAVSSS